MSEYDYYLDHLDAEGLTGDELTFENWQEQRWDAEQERRYIRSHEA